MQIEAERVSNVHLESPLTIRAAAGHRDALLSVISEAPQICVSFDADAEADVCGVQLLQAARVFARSVGKDLTLATPARGKLREVLERGGFIEDASAEDRAFWLHEGA